VPEDAEALTRDCRDEFVAIVRPPRRGPRPDPARHRGEIKVAASLGPHVREIDYAIPS
jgi:hypothetical protein